MILKRRWPVFMHKKNGPPKRLKAKDYVYDMIEDTVHRKHTNDTKLVLTTFVDGIGARGDIISVKPNTAYNKLLLPGLAVYHTPENVAKYARKEGDIEKEAHSSPSAQRCVNILNSLVMGIPMNKHNPWVLEPWHVRAALRRAGINVLDDKCIELPAEKITGPDLNKQNKEFIVTVTVNNCEKARLRCRIHHWTNDIEQRLPYVFEHWLQPAELLLPALDGNSTQSTNSTQTQQ